MRASFIVVVLAVLICVLVLYYIKTKNEERIKLIEKGINPDEGLNITEYRKQAYLKNGILLVSLAIGLIIGHLLVNNNNQLDSFITYVSSLLFFGGIGFILNYLVLRNWKSK